jgi:hypothetical protein
MVDFNGAEHILARAKFTSVGAKLMRLLDQETPGSGAAAVRDQSRRGGVAFRRGAKPQLYMIDHCLPCVVFGFLPACRHGECPAGLPAVPEHLGRGIEIAAVNERQGFRTDVRMSRTFVPPIREACPQSLQLTSRH